MVTAVLIVGNTFPLQWLERLNVPQWMVCICAFMGGNGAGRRAYVENSTTAQRDHGNQLRKERESSLIDMFSQLFWWCQ